MVIITAWFDIKDLVFPTFPRTALANRKWVVVIWLGGTEWTGKCDLDKLQSLNDYSMVAGKSVLCGLCLKFNLRVSFISTANSEYRRLQT